MKKLVILVVVAGAGFFAWNQFTQGGFGARNLTPGQQRVRTLEEQIDAAGGQIAQAGRTAGVSGLDTTSDVESALRQLERIESELQALKRSAKEETTRQECDRLLRKVEATRR
jgi:hypothetical protein